MHTPAPIELMNVCLLRDDANRMLVQDRHRPIVAGALLSRRARRNRRNVVRMPSSAKCRRKPADCRFAPARRHQGVDEARRADPRAGAVL